MFFTCMYSQHLKAMQRILHELHGDFHNTSTCYFGCLHSYIMGTMPCVRKVNVFVFFVQHWTCDSKIFLFCSLFIYTALFMMDVFLQNFHLHFFAWYVLYKRFTDECSLFCRTHFSRALTTFLYGTWHPTGCVTLQHGKKRQLLAVLPCLSKHVPLSAWGNE